MNAPYRIITIDTGDAEFPEIQHYVAEARVTEDQVRQGSDDGVLYYCTSAEAADVIAAALNVQTNASAFRFGTSHQFPETGGCE